MRVRGRPASPLKAGSCGFRHIAEPSGMISQLQSDWMGPKVCLLPQIGLTVFPHIMIHQGDRHDQRNMALSVIVQYLKHFLLFVRGKILFEIPQNMLQHIDVFSDRGLQTERRHQQLLVAVKQCVRQKGVRIGDQFSHLSVMLGAVRQDQKLVTGVKIHQSAGCPAFGKKAPPPPECENPFDEIFSQDRIMPLLGDRLLKMNPQRSSFSSSRTRAPDHSSIRPV